METVGAQDTPGARAGPAQNNGKLMRRVLVIAALLFAVWLGLTFLAYMGVFGKGWFDFFLGLGLGTLPVPLYLLLTLSLDLYEKEPLWLLGGTFVSGVAVAIVLAFLFGIIDPKMFNPFFGAAVEEAAKGLVLLGLYLWKRNEFDGVVDGVIYAAMVGLGFATLENVVFYWKISAHGVDGALFHTFILRGVVSSFAHPLFTSITGIGLGLASQPTRSFVKFGAPVVGLLIGTGLHAVWNYSGGRGQIGSLATYLLLMIPALIVVLITVYAALRREAFLIRTYLTPELDAGLITQEEYDALGSVAGSIRSFLRAVRSGGLAGWRNHSRFTQTVTELAFRRYRVEHDLPVDSHNRDEDYVRVLRQTKGHRRTG